MWPGSTSVVLRAPSPYWQSTSRQPRLTWKEGTSPSPGDTICQGAGRLALRENLYTAGWPLLFTLETYTVPGESGRQMKGGEGADSHLAWLPWTWSSPLSVLWPEELSPDLGSFLNVGSVPLHWTEPMVMMGDAGGGRGDGVAGTEEVGGGRGHRDGAAQ